MQISKLIVLFLIIFTLVWSYFDRRFTTVGRWQIPETNYGAIGACGWGPYMGYWPRGSGHNYIFGAGIWIGGILPNGDTVVTIGYGPHGAESEPAPGVPYSDPADPQWHVYFSTDPDYPFTPISLEDGYAVYNDFDTTYHMEDSFHIKEPLGVTFTQRTSVWPKNWADDVVFVQFIIKNDTTYVINDLYAGFCMDFDIGNEAGEAANDRCGIDLSRKLFYGWQEEEEPGTPSWWPGMIGLELLSPFPLASFKRFTLSLEPQWDRERYLVMAGYNYLTGEYEPFDTIWPPPDDQRILMTTGPFNSLVPGDSVVLDWALLAGTDSMPPSPDLENKADRAQAFFELAKLHTVQVTHPNGGEVVSGVDSIGYVASSITGNQLIVDIYLCSEYGTDTIAFETENYGFYEWFTDSFPDCVLGQIVIFVHDTVTFGWDISDDYFTINNLGNTPPYLKVISPQDFDTLAGYVDITWIARDPEFHDSLLLTFYFKGHYDTTFKIIASDEQNDSLYTWNTLPYRNGSGLLVVETKDEEFTVAETIQVYLLNEVSGGEIHHVRGLNNCVYLSCLVHEKTQLTGHTYKFRFLEYCVLPDTEELDVYYYPEYIYEIVDSNTGVTVIDTYSLRNGYTLRQTSLSIDDFSPIADGFSIWAYTESENVISRIHFMNDSVKVVVGTYPEDSIGPQYPLPDGWWAYRGSKLQLDWMTHANGGLMLFVTDLDYGDTIPYKPYGFHLNPESAFGWCFNRFTGNDPCDTLRPGYDRAIYLCGGVIGIRTGTIIPQVGDRWIVYPSEYSPPIEGNVYRFTPYVGISEQRADVLPIHFQVYPIPFSKKLTIAYSIPQNQKVKLVIYDVLGRCVKKLKDGIENPGAYKITWDGFDDKNRKVSAGVYFCRFTVGDSEAHKETKKFVMLK